MIAKMTSWTDIDSEIADWYAELELDSSFFLRVQGRYKSSTRWQVGFFLRRSEGNYEIKHFDLENIPNIEAAKMAAISLAREWLTVILGKLT